MDKTKKTEQCATLMNNGARYRLTTAPRVQRDVLQPVKKKMLRVNPQQRELLPAISELVQRVLITMSADADFVATVSVR